MQKQLEEGMPIIDVLAMSLVGELVSETNDYLVLRWVGILNFRPEAIDGGKQFKLHANLTHKCPMTEFYYVSRAGIRGISFCGDAWLKGLHQAYVKRAEMGEFDLNPFAVVEKVELQNGDTGSPEAPDMAVGTIQALPEKHAETGRGS